MSLLILKLLLLLFLTFTTNPFHIFLKWKMKILRDRNLRNGVQFQAHRTGKMGTLKLPKKSTKQ